MRYPSNESQLKAIVMLLDKLIIAYPAETVGEEIIEELVNDVFLKLQKKASQLYGGKNGWSFNITDLQGKALWVYFQSTATDFPEYPYESLQLKSFFNEIDHIYGRTTRKNPPNRTLASGASARRLDSQTR